MNHLSKIVIVLGLAISSFAQAQSLGADGGTGPGNSKVAGLEIKEISIVSIKEASAVGIKNCGGNIGSFNDSSNCFGVLLKGMTGKDALGNMVSGDMVILGASQYGATTAASNIALAIHGMTVGDLQKQQSAAQFVTDASIANVKVIQAPIPLSSLTGVPAADASSDLQVMLGGITITATNNWRVSGGIASQQSTLTLGVE